MKIENYIDQKFNQAALNHLKSQIVMEIKNDLDNNNTNTQKWKPNASEQWLQPFYREFRRPLTRTNYKKFVLLLSLTIFDNNQNNKTLDQIPENLSLIFTKRK